MQRHEYSKNICDYKIPSWIFGPKIFEDDEWIKLCSEIIHSLHPWANIVINSRKLSLTEH